MSTAEKLLTAEEYSKIAHEYERSELVRGEIVPMTPPGFRHGRVLLRAGYLLQRFLDDHDVGRVAGGDAGVITERDPDTVRGGDVLFYGYERLPADRDPAGYPDVAPHIAFEVRSPSNRWSEIHQKVGEYLGAGVDCVCVLLPENRTAHLFYPEADPVVLQADDELTLPAPLDGFRVPVRRFFE
jgi:Uma2 family endonuclease